MLLSLQNKILSLALILLFAALLGLLCGQRYLLVERLERQAFDWRMINIGREAETPKIIIVQAGEESLRKLGQWPWSRTRHAALLENLAAARLVALDILFPEQSTPEADHALAQAALKHGRVIIAMHIAPDETLFSGILAPPYDELAKAVLAVGVTNVEEDIDGLTRFHTPVRQVGDATAPSLPLAVAAQLLGVNPSVIIDNNSLTLVLGIRTVPLDETGKLWMDFSDLNFETYEYEQVLSGAVNPNTFRDKVVFVGIAASGAEDFHVVPSGIGKRIMPGTEYNAHALVSILAGRIPVRISPLASAALTLALALFGGLSTLLGRPRTNLLFLITAIATYATANVFLFHFQLLWLDLIFPLLALILVHVAMVFVRYQTLHRDWALKSYSLSSLYSLEKAHQEHASLEDFLKAIWPDIKASTGVELLAAQVTLEEAGSDVKRAVNEDISHNAGTPRAVVLRSSRKSTRRKMALPVPVEDDNNEYRYAVLSWRGRLSNDTIQTLAVTVLSATWFFRALSRGREKRRLLTDTIHAIFRAVDYRDPITGGHSDRVATLALDIMAELDIDEDTREDIHLGALIHDIGKIGIPDSVLGKPGKLTGEEFGLILKHPTIGNEIMLPVALPEQARRTLSEHHERYDGSGYPKGLAKKDIILGARIVAVADVFDALRSDRPYRKGLPIYKVCDYIHNGLGTTFDPQMVEILLRLKAPADWKPKEPLLPPKKRSLKNEK